MRRLLAITVLCSLAGCRDGEPGPVLGTTEWDRIALTAQAQEPVVALTVHEGETVEAGQALVAQDPARAQLAVAAAAAEVQRLEALLDQQRNGARVEDVAAARARLARARSVAAEAALSYARAQELRKRGLTSEAALDSARANDASSRAEAEAAIAELARLANGTRVEEIEQTEAALLAAQAHHGQARLGLALLSARAPRAGRVDAIPVRVGDQVMVGQTLLTMLVGERAFARVYVPERVRARTTVGSKFRVQVEGIEGELPATVRWIRSDPSFTPYYALTGDDTSRLTWIAELALDDPRAATLPPGLPVQATALARAP
jgi:HlyD family secretion protein